MADGFVELTQETISTPAGLGELNRMLKTLFDNVAGDTDTRRVYIGQSTPEAQISAGVGSLFLRTDGGASTTLYVKESGTADTGWVAK